MQCNSVPGTGGTGGSAPHSGLAHVGLRQYFSSYTLSHLFDPINKNKL